jgi:hypothetical protein
LNKALHQVYASQHRVNEVFDACINQMFQTTTDCVFTQPRSKSAIHIFRERTLNSEAPITASANRH